MLALRVVSQVLAIVMLAPVMAVLSSVAAAATAPIALQPWQEQSVLAALQDPGAAVRYAAVSWLADKQTSNKAIAAAVAGYLDRGLPSQVKKSAASSLDHMRPAASAFATRLAPLVADPDEEVSLAAANALLHMGPAAAAAAPQLVPLLKARTSGPAFYAAQILARLGPAGTPYVRTIAVIASDHAANGGGEMLAHMGSAAVGLLPIFEKLLKQPNPQLRIEAAEELGDMVALGTPVTALAPKVAALLHDPVSQVRSAALYALGRMGISGAAFLPQVVVLAQDPNFLVKATAFAALTRMGSAGAAVAPKLAALLKNPDPDIRSAAARALGTMGPAAAAYATQVAALLTDTEMAGGLLEPVPADAAAAALRRMGPAVARLAPRFAAELNSRSARERAGAVRGLGAIGPAAARYAPRIIALLASDDTAVDPGYITEAATEALGRMGPAGARLAGPRLVAMLKSPDAVIASNAQLALRKMGMAAAGIAPQLIAMLNDPGGPWGAEDALQALGPAAAPATPKLTALLKNPSYRLVTMRTLGSIGPGAAAAIPQLAALLKDPTADVRSEALKALIHIGSAQAALPIAALLDDRSSDVRLATLTALQSMKPGAAALAPRIAALLGDPDSQVRGAALEVLDHIALVNPLQDRSILLHLLSASHISRSDAPAFLVRAYLYRKVDAQDLILIRWLGNRDASELPSVAQLGRQSVLTALQTFNDTWDQTKGFPRVRKEMAQRIAQLTAAAQ